jgi:hypothetical protein
MGIVAYSNGDGTLKLNENGLSLDEIREEMKRGQQQSRSSI